MKHIDIDPIMLSQFLEYAPEIGGSCLRWKVNIACRGTRINVKAGDMAGTPDRKGYYVLQLKGQPYKAHRVIMAIVSGSDPIYQVDHIDGNKGNNVFENLRVAHRNNADNQQNLTIRKNNTSGYAGVSLHKRTGKWVAQISVGRKRKYLGLFDTPEEAYSAYLTAKAELHTFNPTVRNRLKVEGIALTGCKP